MRKTKNKLTLDLTNLLLCWKILQKKRIMYRNRNPEREPVAHMSNMSHTSDTLPTSPRPLHIGTTGTLLLTMILILLLSTHLVPHNTQGILHHKIDNLTFSHTMIYPEIITMMIQLKKLSWMYLNLMVCLTPLFF